jgi:hypothetical protein
MADIQYSREKMQKQKSKMVTFDLPDYKRATHDNMNGCTVAVEYDSSFGGSQTVEGEGGLIRELERGRFYNYLVVGDRKISSGRVWSAESGRKVGTVESISVTMEADKAIEWVAKDWNGHDVDTHDDEIYVQFWSGQLHDEMSQEEFMNHTDAIRFEK